MATARFRVDPRLATVLGETYKSTEDAIKELVDNAWDADAERVEIELPDIVSSEPILVRDYGTGMTEAEVRQEYLHIASARATRKGDVTPGMKRIVKGRKGVGKFAGLTAAEMMELETRARGVATRLQISKGELLAAALDLEQVDLPISTASCDPDDHGTTVTLCGLNQALARPSPERLKGLLVLDYGREPDFAITVNGEPLCAEDLPGQRFSKELDLDGVGRVAVTLNILDNGLARRNQAGVVLRVGGKVVGRPQFYGLDERDDIPRRFMNRLVGEIEADGLEDVVTADWAGVIENSVAYQAVQQAAREAVIAAAETVFAADIQSANARLGRQIRERLKLLPEHRRHYAEQAVDRVLRRFYSEAGDRVDTLVTLVLDAMEQDAYYLVCQRIEEAGQEGIEQLAEALDAFGLIELATIADRAQQRLRFLDYLDALVADPATLERTMHTALANNLWVLGPEYTLLCSDRTLQEIVSKYLHGQYTGDRAKKRPDLLLSAGPFERHLLIEFKRPSDEVGWDAASQVGKYRADLEQYVSPIAVVTIGGRVDKDARQKHETADFLLWSYSAIISKARRQLEWVTNELGSRMSSEDG